MRSPARTIVAIVLALLFAAACGGDDSDDAAPSTTTTTEPTTTVPPTTEPPPVVLITGDSIVYDVAPAIEAALEPDVADVVSLVTPTLGTESNQTTLLDRIETEGVDVAVVMVGIWERSYRTASGAALGDEAFTAEYPGESLEPLRAALAADGGRLLLVGPPPLRVEADEAQIAVLESIWQGFAEAHDHVDFVDADEWIGGGGVYVDVEVDGPEDASDEDAARLRRTDGIHLCAEGARRIAAGMLDAISPELAGRPPVDPSWERGPWAARFPEDECPAAS